MKKFILFICLLCAVAPLCAQFNNISAMNKYLTDSVRDKRPQKVTIQSIQKAFVGVSSFLLQSAGQVTDTISREEVQILIDSSLLAPGRMYYITDADEDLYGGTPVLIRAISINSFDLNGLGYFHNPNYASGDYAFWNGEYTEVNVTATNGEFLPGETLQSQYGNYGRWVKTGVLLTSDAISPWNFSSSSIWASNPSINAEIEITYIATYEIGERVYWGGRIWTNLAGNRGYQYDDFLLNSEDWEVVPFDDPGYVLAIDPIKYDYVHDRILGRREDAGNNEVYADYKYVEEHSTNTPVKSFQWGNPYRMFATAGIGSQRIYNSINTNINFRGQFQTNIEMTNGSDQNNMHFFDNSSQTSIRLLNGSSQNGIYLFGSQQQNLDFDQSAQYDIAITNGSQYGLTFKNANQFTFTMEECDQQNINLWKINWNRENTHFSYEGETNVFKLPKAPPPENGQSIVRMQYSDVVTIYQQNTPVFANDLAYEMQEGMDYNFEYDLNILANIPADSMLINLNLPSSDSMVVKYIYTNITTGYITSTVSTSSSLGSYYVENQGDAFHIKIVGSIRYSFGGTATLSIAPRVGPYGGNIYLYSGSFARITKAAHIGPPPPR